MPHITMATLIDVCYWASLVSICFIFTLLAKFLTTKYLNPKSFKQLNHPPSPPALPLIGHLHLLSKLFHQSFQKLASQYGPLMKISVGSSSLVVVSDANVSREIMKIQELNFVYKPNIGFQDYSIYTDSGFFMAEYGPYWRFIKKICMTKLLSAPQLTQSVDIRHQELMMLMDVLVTCSERGEACDLGAELMVMTNNIVCRMTMSTRCSGNFNEAAQIRQFIKSISELVSKLAMGEVFGPLHKLDLFGYGKRLRALIIHYNVLIEGIMREKEKARREGEKESKDMMDFLLEIYEDEASEVKLTRDNIKVFFLEIFFAGTETTCNGLLWVLAELINNPRVLMKLREEISAVVGSHRLVEESDLLNLYYLQAVVKESLRLHPPLPLIVRKSKEDCKINGYDVLKDTRIILNAYAIMRDPSSWKNPTEFLPERFMEDINNDQLGILGEDNRFMPFGSGRRACPGKLLAWNVIQVVTASLVQCFDWKPKDGEYVDMREGSGGTMAHPLLCYPVLHVNPFSIFPRSC